MRRLTLSNDNRRWTILALVVAVVLILTTFALFFSPKAYAARGTDWIELDEIVLPTSTYGSVKFNQNVLDELYHCLTGRSSFSDVQQAARAKTTSASFRAFNGNNISIRFGGMKWDAVYLTTATNGDVILDLWRSSDEVSSDSIRFSSWRSGDTSLTYPSNMYTTSYIRAIGLNAAGAVYTNSSTDMSVLFQYDDVQYAPFTVSGYNSVTGYSLTPFIATPKQVGYQANEWDEGTAAAMDSHKYLFPNDAYETPSGGAWYRSGFNYLANDGDRTQSATKYGAWQNDYLWLPSMTETGFNDSDGNGIWDTDAALRSGPNMQWLRSGKYDDASSIYRLNTSGGITKNFTNYVDSTGCMRPALHLNLTEVEAHSEAPSVICTYTFELPDSAEFAVKNGATTATIDITARDIVVPAGQTLTLYVKSEHGEADDKFFLVMGGGRAEYTLSVTGGLNVVESGDFDPTNGRVIWQLAGPQTVDLEEFTITLTLISPTAVAGDWLDSLKFTAVVI